MNYTIIVTSAIWQCLPHFYYFFFFVINKWVIFVLQNIWRKNKQAHWQWTLNIKIVLAMRVKRRPDLISSTFFFFDLILAPMNEQIKSFFLNWRWFFWLYLSRFFLGFAWFLVSRRFIEHLPRLRNSLGQFMSHFIDHGPSFKNITDICFKSEKFAEAADL